MCNCLLAGAMRPEQTIILFKADLDVRIGVVMLVKWTISPLNLIILGLQSLEEFQVKLAFISNENDLQFTSTPTSWAIPCIKAGTTAVRSIEADVATETVLRGGFSSNALLMNFWTDQARKDWVSMRTN